MGPLRPLRCPPIPFAVQSSLCAPLLFIGVGRWGRVSRPPYRAFPGKITASVLVAEPGIGATGAAVVATIPEGWRQDMSAPVEHWHWAGGAQRAPSCPSSRLHPGKNPLRTFFSFYPFFFPFFFFCCYVERVLYICNPSDPFDRFGFDRDEPADLLDYPSLLGSTCCCVKPTPWDLCLCVVVPNTAFVRVNMDGLCLSIHSFTKQPFNLQYRQHALYYDVGIIHYTHTYILSIMAQNKKRRK